MNNQSIKELFLMMGRTEQYMPSPNDVVADNEIITSISQIGDLELKDRMGRTLLMNAAFYGRYDVVQYLINHGASIHATCKQNFTALHGATMFRHIDVVKLLIENGADVNARDMWGNSPLMRCDLATPDELFRILIRAGANPAQQNNYGQSALDVFEAYPNILALLQSCDES